MKGAGQGCKYFETTVLKSQTKKSDCRMVRDKKLCDVIYGRHVSKKNFSDDSMKTLKDFSNVTDANAVFNFKYSGFKKMRPSIFEYNSQLNQIT